MKALCLVLVTLLVTVSSALVQGMSVDPVKASCSGWTTLQNNYVSQTVTCNWDELDSTCYVLVFADCACALGESA